MVEYETLKDVEKAYITEELTIMDAIEILQDQFGYVSREAEALVESWS